LHARRIRKNQEDPPNLSLGDFNQPVGFLTPWRESLELVAAFAEKRKKQRGTRRVNILILELYPDRKASMVAIYGFKTPQAPQCLP
jgi:hypothetical protein